MSGSVRDAVAVAARTVKWGRHYRWGRPQASKAAATAATRPPRLPVEDTTFDAAYAAVRQSFGKASLSAIAKDMGTLSPTLPTFVKLQSHAERLNFFEDMMPRESLEWIADNVQDTEGWGSLFDGPPPAEPTNESSGRGWFPPVRQSDMERLVLLSAGKDAWDARLLLLQQARTEIQMVSAYIYLDTYGWKFCEALAAASRRGVKVQLVLDEFGAMSFEFGGQSTGHPCRSEPTEWEHMMELLTDSGVEVAYWRGMSSSTPPFHFSTKNHTKSLIVDGRYAIVGDRNIGAEYFDEWTGADVLVEGRAAEQLQSSFYEDLPPFLLPVNPASQLLDDTGALKEVPWQWSGKGGPSDGSSSEQNTSTHSDQNSAIEEGLASFTHLYPPLNQTDSEGIVGSKATIDAQIIAHVPTASGYDPILHSLVHQIRAAKDAVDIRSCYIVLPGFLQDELADAVRRGVRVRLISNSRHTNDLMFIHAAMVDSLVVPAKAGVEVYLTTEQMDHTKFIIVDRRWISFGSWNCWLRTPFYEGETNVVVDDAAVGEVLAASEVDALISDTPDIVKYTAAQLEDEAQIVSRDVCPPDRFHKTFSFSPARLQKNA